MTQNVREEVEYVRQRPAFDENKLINQISQKMADKQRADEYNRKEAAEQQRAMMEAVVSKFKGK